ncbi:hypothetical protein [Aquipuribacter sp. SD81]|uniref:hypothetical protein n=1 Tax=Aquipuribacter sp. SD81 TaxID=3127703 RepID=UPI0030184B8C
MSAPRLLVDGFTLVGPDDWLQLPVEPLPEDSAEAVLLQVVREQRPDAPEAGEVDLAQLAAVQREVAARTAQALAVWLPADAAPAVAGAGVVELLLPEAGGVPAWEDLVAAVADEPPAPGSSRQWRTVHVLDDVPWGEVVMAHEVASADGAPLEERLTYLGRPHGSDDLLRLAFSTPYLALSEPFREGAVALLLHLEVHLVTDG